MWNVCRCVCRCVCKCVCKCVCYVTRLQLLCLQTSKPELTEAKQPAAVEMEG